MRRWISLLVVNYYFAQSYFFFFLISLEGGIRGFYLVQNKILPRAAHLSEDFGWVNIANLKSTRTFKKYGEVPYSTTQYGFRVFGNINTTKTKIFIIGDSQTAARKVTDGETYYDYIEQHTESEIFAYGGGGYGTLQEYMILDKFFNLIQPDIILWQFSANDIHNNSWALESSSWKNNNHMTRPYYEDSKIKYRFPHSSWIYRHILRHSYLVKLFNIKLDILLIENLGPIPSELLSERHPLFQEAVNTTAEIMGLVKNRVRESPIVAFSASTYRSKPIRDKIFLDICHELEIPYIEGVVEAIEEAATSGMIVDGQPYDSHWNNNAHAIAGEIIVGHLIDKGLLNKKELIDRFPK